MDVENRLQRGRLDEEFGISRCKLLYPEKDGNTRPPDLPLEKPVCRSGSNS